MESSYHTESGCKWISFNLTIYKSKQLYMDNHYSAPELFVMLKKKYKILACCTVRINRTGWDTVTIGESKRFCNPINGILFG